MLAAFFNYYGKHRSIPLLDNDLPKHLDPVTDEEADHVFGKGQGVGDIPVFRAESLYETSVVYVNATALSDKIDSLLNLGRVPRGPFTSPRETRRGWVSAGREDIGSPTLRRGRGATSSG